MVASGCVFILAGLHQSKYFSPCHSFVARLISPLMLSEWQDIPSRATALIVRGYDAYVYYWFRQSEKNFLNSSLFITVVIIGIPAGAVLNMARGGSPLLLVLLVGICIGFCTLAILSEMNRLNRVAAALSASLFMALFIFVPAYVFHSLTDRLLNLSVSNAFIGSFLIVPLLYLAAQSSVLAIRLVWPGDALNGDSWIERQASYLAAGFPVAYLLTFVSFLAKAHPDGPSLVPMTWPVVIMGLVVISLSTSIAAQTCAMAARQNSTGAWSIVIFVNIAAPAFLLFFVLINGAGVYADLVSQSLWQWFSMISARMSQPSPISLFWILQLAFVPISVILVFNCVVLVARLVSHLASRIDRDHLDYTSSNCLLFGCSIAVIGALKAVITIWLRS